MIDEIVSGKIDRDEAVDIYKNIVVGKLVTVKE